MSNFLANLVLASRGQLPTVRPRLQALFEPPRTAGQGLWATAAFPGPETPYVDAAALGERQPAFEYRAPEPRLAPHSDAVRPVTTLAGEMEPPVEFGGATPLHATAASPSPVDRAHEPALGVPRVLLDAIHAEASAAQPAHSPAAEQMPLRSPLRRRDHPPQTAAPATALAAEPSAEQEAAVSPPALAPTPAGGPIPGYLRSAGKPPTLIQPAEPALDATQQPPAAQSPQVLSPGKVASTTAGGPQASPAPAPNTALRESVEGQGFAQGLPARQPVDEAGGSSAIEAVAQARLRLDAPAPEQRGAFMAAPPLPTVEAAEPAPVIRVTIGRIEVRAVQPNPPPAPRPAARQPDNRLSLEEYLKQGRRSP